jgi:hypothetical protein
MVTAMRMFRSRVTSSRYDATSAWNRLLKRTIGRFVRGNIAAQNQRILLPDEQKKQHERARSVAAQWRRPAG